MGAAIKLQAPAPCPQALRAQAAPRSALEAGEGSEAPPRPTPVADSLTFFPGRAWREGARRGDGCRRGNGPPRLCRGGRASARHICSDTCQPRRVLGHGVSRVPAPRRRQMREVTIAA